MPQSLEVRQAGDLPSEHVYVVPLVATVFSIILAILSISVLSAFFALRILRVTSWRKLPLVSWVILAIYIDSWLFVAISTILRWGPGISTSWDLCSAAIFLCLSCYLSTKLIYFFLVEKAFVVWGGRKSRLQSKLYIFNSFGMLSIFAIIGIFNFIYRITYLEDGKCIIGMQRPVLIPLVSFDLAVNVYLTILFLIPLWKTYSFSSADKSSGNAKLRDLVVRTFIGAVTSTITCLLNIVIMMALNGEPGWLCLMSCNIDLLFDAVIVHYVTSRDNRSLQTTDQYYNNNNHSVAVERSVIIHHSKTRNGTGLDKSCKRGSLQHTEEEISMSKLGAKPAGYNSTETIKGDSSSSRSYDSGNEMELGNRTDIVAATKDF